MAANTTSRHATPGIPKGTFREKRGSAPSYDELAWEHEVSEVLTLPPSAPPADVYPDIETALFAASEQLHRRPSQPELPPIADKYRRAKA